MSKLINNNKGEVMKTYMISYTSNGQAFREEKTTALKPHQIKKHYENLGCVNLKVRVLV